MTDPETADKPAETSAKTNGVPFKKGYDARRWMTGRPKKPKDLKAAEELVQHVIWEELSREITDGKGEAVDALRLMIRSMIRNKTTQKEILERIAGKVTDRHELTGKDGEPLIPKETDNERFDRAISTLANTLRDSLSGQGAKSSGEVDTTK